jgi:hypothetical protein
MIVRSGGRGGVVIDVMGACRVGQYLGTRPLLSPMRRRAEALEADKTPAVGEANHEWRLESKPARKVTIT